ncbi:TetR-like C-terminal domain-containing protein [Paenibacillus sp. FSL H8-0537]|uniref:TetR-like C-terminal domain-containing protein n=1 Tax=Paenibacillus sp. FSL H8-0537 TaxID=2921399 RepID=UPI003100BA39
MYTELAIITPVASATFKCEATTDSLLKHVKHLNTTFQLNSSSIDAEIVTEAHIGAILGVLNWWIENKMPIDQGEIYKMLEDWDFSVFNNKKQRTPL